MGVRGLTSYLTRNPCRFLEKCELHDTYLIVDGGNVYSDLYEHADKQHGRFGGQYDIFHKSVEEFFNYLQLCKITPIVFLDGLPVMSKSNYFEKCKNKNEHSKRNHFTRPPMLRFAFLEIMQSKNIKCVQTLTEGEEMISSVAKALDCPVLSNDGDFFLHGCKVISLNLKGFVPTRRTTEGEDQDKFFIPCKIYNATRFCEHFNYLDESLLPLALMLLGNKWECSLLDSSKLKPFFHHLDSFSSRASAVSHRKIEKTLKWLSFYANLEEAVTALLKYIDVKNREKILEDIKKFTSGIGSGLSLTLHILGLSELEPKILEQSKKKSLCIQSKVKELISPPNDGDDGRAEREVGKDVNINDNHEYTEEEMIDLFPKWFIDDYIKGRMAKAPMELLMFSAKPMKPPKEEYLKPIWIAIYSLMSTLRDSDQNSLELFSIEDGNVLREEIIVKKSSVNLRDIKELDFTERKKIIDEVLEVNEVDSIMDLPDDWRLYAETVVFWMRQDFLPEKTGSHLHAVIFLMLLGIIDDKLGVVRSQDSFSKTFGDDYQEITSSSVTKDGIGGQSLTKMVMDISREECIAASPFFIAHLEIDSSDDEKAVVESFKQLESCVRYSMILNWMLICPYTPVRLHTVYNGFLLYKAFKVFSTKEDVDSYLRSKLEYSPTILEVFLILKRTFLKMIGKDI